MIVKLAGGLIKNRSACGEGGWVDLKFIIAYECIWCTWIGGIQNLESLRKLTGGGGAWFW